jgi:hypothetical protein
LYESLLGKERYTRRRWFGMFEKAVGKSISHLRAHIGRGARRRWNLEGQKGIRKSYVGLLKTAVKTEGKQMYPAGAHQEGS